MNLNLLFSETWDSKRSVHKYHSFYKPSHKINCTNATDISGSYFWNQWLYISIYRMYSGPCCKNTICIQSHSHMLAPSFALDYVCYMKLSWVAPDHLLILSARNTSQSTEGFVACQQGSLFKQHNFWISKDTSDLHRDLSSFFFSECSFIPQYSARAHYWLTCLVNDTSGKPFWFLLWEGHWPDLFKCLYSQNFENKFFFQNQSSWYLQVVILKRKTCVNTNKIIQTTRTGMQCELFSIAHLALARTDPATCYHKNMVVWSGLEIRNEQHEWLCC